MCLVNDECRIPGKVWFRQKFSEQHPIRHVLQHRFVAGTIFEPDRITDFIPDFGTHFLSNTCGDGHGSNTTWLRTSHLQTAGGISGLMEILRKLGCLSRSGFGDNYKNLVFFDGVY
jgi:hypothetical protein